MKQSALLSELIELSANRLPGASALRYGGRSLSYDELWKAARAAAGGLLALGLARAERVAVYLEKRFETVIAIFGAAAAGGVFVPINPLLKAEQVAYILRDCNVRVLVTSAERLKALASALADCPDLRHVVVVDGAVPASHLPRGLKMPDGARPASQTLSPVPSPRGEGDLALDRARNAPLPPGGGASPPLPPPLGEGNGPVPLSLWERGPGEGSSEQVGCVERSETHRSTVGKAVLSPWESGQTGADDGQSIACGALKGLSVHAWDALLSSPSRPGHRVIDTDMAAILYTSGSTGRPKGVVLSHRNLVAGAKSVAQYLENGPEDTLLAALPLSFDAGFSQLTTAFHVGARVVLLNYLLPQDVVKALEREKVTGLTAVPPLWIQLTQVAWPERVAEHLRYIANTGGRMPLETLKALRARLPGTKVYLMYGLTEAFRSTYLPPEEVDRRPDSIGKAIPNAEILVLREDGTPCGPNEPGELVHRGALVAMGYWNDPEKTAERFKPLPGQEAGLVLPEIAVFSGDTVRMDEEGFLYFIGRRDEMIKTSGYRVSPTEIEEVLYSTRLLAEAAAFGVEHPTLGQAIVVVAVPKDGRDPTAEAILAECRARLPAYMVPAHVDLRREALPRNPNGKIDRKSLAQAFAGMFQAPALG